jgi:hypothetical protein
MGIRWLLVGIAAVVLGLAIAWVMLVPAADWLAHHDVGSLKGPALQASRDAARGRLLTLGAGLLAAGALLFTARNFVLSREGQVTDRYTKAIEQLGSEKLDVRIGGIYALERIARDSAKDHPTVIEVLTAFIREHSHEQRPEPEPFTWQTPRPDVQAALTVVGRRDAKRDIRRVDLSRADLGGADLRNAFLGGRIVTRGPTTTYFPGADLRFAILSHGDLWLADLTRANLSGADLSNAGLNSAFLRDADLSTAKLTSADLTGAQLGGAKLLLADLFGAELKDARSLDTATFGGAKLDGASWPEDAAVPKGWIRVSGRLVRGGPRR